MAKEDIDTSAVGYIQEGLSRLGVDISDAQQRVATATALLTDAQATLDMLLEKRANLIAAARQIQGTP